MTLPTDDRQRFALVRERLYTPVVGDILDALGCVHQFLPQPVQPLREPEKWSGLTVRQAGFQTWAARFANRRQGGMA